MDKQTAKFRFGKRVRELRLKRGWAQRELARRAGISKRYLQRIESKQPPDVTLDTIAKISSAFRIKVSWILI